MTYIAPADIKGTSVLTWEHANKEDDQWLFLPALRKSRRISASNKKDRFVGTEVTYEDLSNYLSEDLADFEYNFIRKEVRNGQNCQVLEAIPIKKEVREKSAYSKRIIWITEKETLDIYTEYYNKKGELSKTFSASNIVKIKNSYRALDIIVKNIKTGNSTEIHYTNIEIDEGIADNLFTKQYLESL